MEDEAIVDEILAAVEQLMQAAGPEWTLQFIQAGIEQTANGGGEPPMDGAQPEVMSQGGPSAMPPQGRTVGKPRMM